MDLLGSGGMGEVYRARDLKLKREVAMKVLTEPFACDVERLARFRREAQVLAALNHPNIAAIYGLEESGQTTALVMEIVESPDLAGPLELDTALDYARQIAEALEAAHEKGIVHRDLKPSNIKITSAGVVKVLDFGLATFVQSGETENAADPRTSPTLTQTIGTQPGVILGTAAYMSPEQAAGKPVDKRSDIWSFGAVLFEMLTGERLFPAGESVSHLLADVLRAPIDLTRLPAPVPAEVRQLLQRCLERNVKNRLRDIGEARIAIERARKAPPDSLAPVSAKSSNSKLWIAVAAVALAVSGIAGLGWWRASTASDRPLLRFTDDAGQEIVTTNSNGPSVAISPDGLRVVYVVKISGGKTGLFLRPLNAAKGTALTGTDGAVSPFFSPDGHWIGFFSESKLKKISIEGGAAITLCDVGGTGNPRGGYWGEDENILFSTQRSPVMRVSSSGGTPTAATELANGEVTNRFAQLLPGGDAFLFTASVDNNVWEDATIYVQSVQTKTRKKLLTGGYYGRYLPAGKGKGYLLYVHEGVLFAAPMDLKRLELTGAGIPIVEDASGLVQNGFGQWGVSSSGSILYVPGASQILQTPLALVDLAGKVQVLPAPAARYEGPARPSPDGKRILVRVTESGGMNMSTYELESQRLTRLTFLKRTLINQGIWTPDGKHIVFPIVSNDVLGPGIYWIRADGAGEPQRLTNLHAFPYSFSPDGKRLAFFMNPGTGSSESAIWTMTLNLDDPENPKPGMPELFLKSANPLTNPSFSPDGRWIAYISAEAQPAQLFVRAFKPNSAGAGGQWQISNNGANAPFWSATSNELLYTLGGTGIQAVSYSTTADTFVAGPAHTVLENLPSLNGPPASMPDAKHFAVVLSGPQTASRETHVTFLLNFSAELDRRLSSAK